MSKKKNQKQFPWPERTVRAFHWKRENGKLVKKEGPAGVSSGMTSLDARDAFGTFGIMAVMFLFFGIAMLFMAEEEDALPATIFFFVFLLAAISNGAIAVYGFLSWREDVKQAEQERRAREEKQRLWRESCRKPRNIRKSTE